MERDVQITPRDVVEFLRFLSYGEYIPLDGMNCLEDTTSNLQGGYKPKPVRILIPKSMDKGWVRAELQGINIRTSRYNWSDDTMPKSLKYVVKYFSKKISLRGLSLIS